MLDLTWDYPTARAARRARRRGGAARDQRLRAPDGALLAATRELRADGSTACGCWIYCGCFADGVNQTARRRPGAEQSWVAPEWGWAWPLNRRMLYNRASADPDGRPWSERKRYVWWDADAGQLDRRRTCPTSRPTCRRTTSRRRAPRPEDALRGDEPFVMQADGRGWLFAPTRRGRRPAARPLRAARVAVRQPALRRSRPTPRASLTRHRENPFNPSAGEPGAEVFPYVVTTYRLTEHHTAGAMSRTLPYLAELQPEMFCEVGPGAGRASAASSTAAGRRSSPRARRSRRACW